MTTKEELILEDISKLTGPLWELYKPVKQILERHLAEMIPVAEVEKKISIIYDEVVCKNWNDTISPKDKIREILLPHKQDNE